MFERLVSSQANWLVENFLKCLCQVLLKLSDELIEQLLTEVLQRLLDAVGRRRVRGRSGSSFRSTRALSASYRSRSLSRWPSRLREAAGDFRLSPICHPG